MLTKQKKGATWRWWNCCNIIAVSLLVTSFVFQFISLSFFPHTITQNKQRKENQSWVMHHPPAPNCTPQKHLSSLNLLFWLLHNTKTKTFNSNISKPWNNFISYSFFTFLEAFQLLQLSLLNSSPYSHSNHHLSTLYIIYAIGILLLILFGATGPGSNVTNTIV